MLNWMRKTNNNDADAYTSTIDGMKKVYKKYVRPLEELYRYQEFYSPLLTDRLVHALNFRSSSPLGSPSLPAPSLPLSAPPPVPPSPRTPPLTSPLHLSATVQPGLWNVVRFYFSQIRCIIVFFKYIA